MLATLLAVQLSAEIAGRAAERPLLLSPPAVAVRVLPTERPKACAVAGRLEAAYPEPVALYRSGDRPGRVLRHWTDYQAASPCLIGPAPSP